jgi:hypothetical protein
MDSWSQTVSTGCGLLSTNTLWPASISADTAWWNRTGCRRLRYQYSASSVVVSTAVPVTVE